MKTPFQGKIDLNNLDPEVKSYIYQTLTEFEPFSTQNTLVSVVAKDPLRLISQDDALHEHDLQDLDKKSIKKLFRISISLAEDGSRVEQEGVHENIIEAIRLAKDKLLKVLLEIQDNAISNQDRTAQINEVRAAQNIH